MKKIAAVFVLAIATLAVQAQWNWKNVDSLYGPLPKGVHVYTTNDLVDGKPNIAYYVSADLKEKGIEFTTQVGNGKRLTPTQYFEQEGKPLLVMNCTFFEFVHNSNLNVVVKEGKMAAYQQHTINGRGKDTFTYRHPFGSAIGIARNRKADVAWLYTDSAQSIPYASQKPIAAFKDSVAKHTGKEMLQMGDFKKWKMDAAVGGGPVLVQDGEVKISNNEEMKFGGKQIDDKHPRTAMGYTKDGKLIMLVIEGRFPNKAEGATLTQEARMLKEIGCVEALNLDGGGSSCMLVNGKQTITPSDKEQQRQVPAVFMIKAK
ncbi:phosphodiester glycosidase family protein [Sediminibacterium roseum]|uniref:Phosphodiester glycosidase family protein n=1 Tax=Sediminibacterium roseum TaxID=1978412 RepID=A0ABX0A204_9BACT|nr:phosphodiester glycosidase family protein [Sediminibacterium roseum]NCI51186.1 phosphodiester glycosidase family protein [Sediminibacterium roseum]